MRVLRTLLFCAMCCVCAQAGDISYVTPVGSTVTGGPVDAVVGFSTSTGMSAGTISISLVNLEGNPRDVGQLLSGLSFTLGNGSLSGSSLTSSVGFEKTVNSDGSSTQGPTVSTGWGFKTSGTTIATLEVLGTSTAPTHLIIAGPGSTGYSNANGSIAGNKAHNPFLFNSATFVITGPDISPTTISSVFFSFGTTPGHTIRGFSIPEPSAELMLGLGTLGLMGLATASRKLISA